MNTRLRKRKAGVRSRAKDRTKRVSPARIRRRRRAAVTVVALVIATSGLAALYYSDLFDVQRVGVAGSGHTSTEDIVAASGVVVGKTSLVRLPRSRIVENLKQLPWVDDVELSSALLQKRLDIVIVEKTPVAVVPFGRAHFLIDAGANVIARASKKERSGLPVVSDLTIAQPIIGRQVSAAALAAALKVLISLSQSARRDINSVSAPSPTELTLYDSHGVEILYGDANDRASKNYIFRKILRQWGGRVTFIDVRMPGNPTVRPLKKR